MDIDFKVISKKITEGVMNNKPQKDMIRLVFSNVENTDLDLWRRWYGFFNTIPLCKMTPKMQSLKILAKSIDYDPVDKIITVIVTVKGSDSTIWN